MKRKKMMLMSMVVFSLVVFTGIIFVKTGIVESQTMPFGTNEDVEYSKRLWQVLVKEKLSRAECDSNASV